MYIEQLILPKRKTGLPPNIFNAVITLVRRAELPHKEIDLILKLQSGTTGRIMKHVQGGERKKSGIHKGRCLELLAEKAKHMYESSLNSYYKRRDQISEKRKIDYANEKNNNRKTSI